MLRTKWLLGLVWVGVTACATPPDIPELPFFNSSELTPEWDAGAGLAVEGLRVAGFVERQDIDY